MSRAMLEALRECSAVLDRLLNSDEPPTREELEKALNDADSAIAFAEGQR